MLLAARCVYCTGSAELRTGNNPRQVAGSSSRLRGDCPEFRATPCRPPHNDKVSEKPGNRDFSGSPSFVPTAFRHRRRLAGIPNLHAGRTELTCTQISTGLRTMSVSGPNVPPKGKRLSILGVRKSNALPSVHLVRTACSPSSHVYIFQGSHLELLLAAGILGFCPGRHGSVNHLQKILQRSSTPVRRADWKSVRYRPVGTPHTSDSSSY